jgi:general stress protein 26
MSDQGFHNSPEQKQKFHDLLARFETAMLVTHTNDGSIRARPMAIAGVEEDSHVWFFTEQESGKVEEIVLDTHVAVVCQKDREVYLSLTGKASLLKDPAKAQELWKPEFKAWFPKGVDDPNLALVYVTPAEGEYWDNAGMQKIKYLFEAAKALATGTKPHIDEGEQHAKVQL